MRTASTLFSVLIASSIWAQLLLNPSFEDATGGSLDYWAHACLAQSVMGAAPGSGDWCAAAEASNPQGCIWASLYQVVPGAFDGMIFFLGGWCRNATGVWAPSIGFDIGILDAVGTITPLGLGLATTDTTWTWLSTNDTLHLAPNEQAVVICNSGLVGGPAFAMPRFDGIEFFETFPFSIEEAPRLTSHLDLTDGYLAVSCTNARILAVRILDALGREVSTAPMPATMATVHVPVSALSRGVFVAAVRTERGESAVRFALQ